MPPGVETIYDPTNPLIVQGDRSVLVEVDNPRYAEARDALAPFAELEKSPEHIHTYRLTPLSLWNAAAAGMTADAMVDVLRRYSKFPLPTNLADRHRRAGQPLRPRQARASTSDRLRLVCADRPLLEELARQPKVRDYLGDRLDADSFAIEPAFRGVLKQALIAVGYPAEDLAGYTEGAGPADPAARRWPASACRSTSATTSARRPTSSTPAATCAAAAASSCCPAAPARPSSASPPWR